jgi:hypothetical protein
MLKYNLKKHRLRGDDPTSVDPSSRNAPTILSRQLDLNDWSSVL